MTWKKRSIIFGSILFAMFLLVACGDNNGNDDNASNSNGEDKPTNITMMQTLHTAEVPTERVQELLEEKANVELDIDWVPDNNYNERLNTAFATGTLPQVMSVGFQQMDQFKIGRASCRQGGGISI